MHNLTSKTANISTNTCLRRGSSHLMLYLWRMFGGNKCYSAFETKHSCHSRFYCQMMMNQVFRGLTWHFYIVHLYIKIARIPLALKLESQRYILYVCWRFDSMSLYRASRVAQPAAATVFMQNPILTKAMHLILGSLRRSDSIVTCRL